jgi:hypothetical protein
VRIIVITYLCIKAAKSLFNVLREQLSPRPLATEATNLDVSDVKMTLTLTAVVKSNGREIGFRGFTDRKYSWSTQ